MILRCLSNLSKSTTKGKDYIVIKETDHFFMIIDDNNNITNVARCFIGKFFEVVD